MKLNLALATSLISLATEPELGSDSQVYFAPENMIPLGTLDATGASAATWNAAGGAAIPAVNPFGVAAVGRELVLRALGPVRGSGGAMTATFNVTLDDDSADTAVATFHLPTWSDNGGINLFPQGVSVDLIPATPGNAAKKIKAVGTLVSVANQTAGNRFELLTTPNSADFAFIGCTSSKAGQFSYPGQVEIPCGDNPSAYTRTGRGEVPQLSVGFRSRGELMQLHPFAMTKGTARIDVVKGAGTVLSSRILYGGWIPRPQTPRGDGNDIVEATCEGSYERWAIGYPRFA